MTIQLNPEQEQVVGLAIQAGLIHGADDVIEVGVETIRRRLEAQLASKSALEAEEWSHELHSWIQSHSTAEPLLSDEAISRESIYGSRDH